MRVCLYEDSLVADLEPLCLVRPVFDLLCGCSTLGEKQRRAIATDATGVLVRPLLADMLRAQSPQLPVNDLDWLREDTVALINGRWLPPANGLSVPTPSVGLCNGEIAYAIVPAELLTDCTPHTLDACLLRWRALLPTRSAGGQMVRYLWDLVDANGEQIAEDVARTAFARSGRNSESPAIVGPVDQLFMDPSAQLDPYVVIDTTAGPVVLDREVKVTAFTRLEGPCYIGPGSQLFGAKIRAGTSMGPQCRVGGEVECSILLGYSNKYHDGFLGHAYLGSWVNLGAGTSNSDLRNDYGEVKVVVRGQQVSTGKAKVGCFLGDHTKAGLGTLLNTGTMAGVFCNLLPSGGLLPKSIPSFLSVWNGALRDNTDLEKSLTTAHTVMARRGQVLTERLKQLYGRVWEQTAEQRRLALREAEIRRLRRSA